MAKKVKSPAVQEAVQAYRKHARWPVIVKPALISAAKATAVAAVVGVGLVILKR
jgi:hypothetical protein